MNNAQIGITCRAHWGLHISWHNYKILTTLDGRTSSTALMSIPSCSRSHSIHSNSPRVAHRWMRAWPSPTCVEIKWLRKQSQQTDTFRFARFFEPLNLHSATGVWNPVSFVCQINFPGVQTCEVSSSPFFLGIASYSALDCASKTYMKGEDGEKN